MDDPAAWQRVGEALTDRFEELLMSKAELIEKSGVSDKTLKAYLAGEPIRRMDKRRDLALALGWTADSINRVLEGGTPVLANGGEDLHPGGDRVDVLASAVAEMRQEMATYRAEVSDLLAQMESLAETVRDALRA